MTCTTCQNRLYDYLDGTLSPRATKAFTAHLDRCADCRAALDRERALAGQLTQALTSTTADVDVAPNLVFKVNAALTDTQYSTSFYKRYFMKKPRFSISFVELLVVITIVGILASLGLAPFGPLSKSAFKTIEFRETPIMAIASPEFNTEDYSRIYENEFLEARNNPLSTFSIDVDSAAYANIRRFITQQMRPPKDAVRIEELINYFHYDYPQPTGAHPFTITTEGAPCPWNSNNTLVMIGLQGKTMAMTNLPPNNLVFLLDVSGSMDEPNKLPLVKAAIKLLVNELRPMDRVALVVYAGAAGLVLESTPGDEKARITAALEQLQAGGSTAGGAGVQLAYTIAKQHFLSNGNNRVILATDGDFNVGASSDAALVRMIEEKRNDGIYLTVLGFGMGNYKDNKMEQLADKGNGNYAYIDSILEAKKVLVQQLGATLFTIAKDVKLQIEFNPAMVKAYRLVGYENRMLKAEDFNDDKKDAGELGAGHSVTAFYELVPAGSTQTFASIDPLKYQTTTPQPSDELLTVKFRYKRPDETNSVLLAQTLSARDLDSGAPSENFRFASAVAEFGLLLRDSQFKGTASFNEVLERARGAKGADNDGYRAEFIRLVEQAELLPQQ
ncbi:MAG: von Willebrand factor type A domain-containing protein [bacterium]|nr:von Willebrand factor type A domain-containing protein [bacterium]